MRIIAILAVLLLFSTSSFAAVPDTTGVLEESHNQIMKFTDKGISPPVVRIKTTDSIVFFLNNSTDSLATMEVVFGEKSTHCSSSNMKIEQAGVVRSREPFGPKGFSTICFHDPGSYPVTVYGLKSNPSGEKATIIVE